MNCYNDTISFWDDVFVNKEPRKNIENLKIHEDLEKAIGWLSNESETILDYGCGNGTMIFKCAAYDNVHKCLGIDISAKAVDLCKKTAVANSLETKTDFYCGGIGVLETIEDNSFDGAILSNIIDNVTPEDAVKILKNISRIVAPNGKVLIKLNSYLKQEQLDEYELQLVGDNLYIEKEGIYLRNLTKEQWEDVFKQFFIIDKYKEIYFKEFDQYNRSFLLINKR